VHFGDVIASFAKSDDGPITNLLHVSDTSYLAVRSRVMIPFLLMPGNCKGATIIERKRPKVRSPLVSCLLQWVGITAPVVRLQTPLVCLMALGYSFPNL